MTDAATPEAPKRIRRNRPTKYPAQLAVMLEQSMYDEIEAEAGEDRSKGEVAREWMEAGRAALRRDDVDDAPVQTERATA